MTKIKSRTKPRTYEDIWEFDKWLYRKYELHGIIDYLKIDERKKSKIEADIKCTEENGDIELVEAKKLCIELGLEYDAGNFSFILWRLGYNSAVPTGIDAKIVTAKSSEYIRNGSGYFSIRIMKNKRK